MDALAAISAKLLVPSRINRVHLCEILQGLGLVKIVVLPWSCWCGTLEQVVILLLFAAMVDRPLVQGIHHGGLRDLLVVDRVGVALISTTQRFILDVQFSLRWLGRAVTNLGLCLGLTPFGYWPFNCGADSFLNWFEFDAWLLDHLFCVGGVKDRAVYFLMHKLAEDVWVPAHLRFWFIKDHSVLGTVHLNHFIFLLWGDSLAHRGHLASEGNRRARPVQVGRVIVCRSHSGMYLHRFAHGGLYVLSLAFAGERANPVCIESLF